MIRKRILVSNALREVWEWKDECYREVAHLPVRKGIESRMRDAAATAGRLGFKMVELERRHPAMVAEERAAYGRKFNRS